jgi:hypothetical protein
VIDDPDNDQLYMVSEFISGGAVMPDERYIFSGRACVWGAWDLGAGVWGGGGYRGGGGVVQLKAPGHVVGTSLSCIWSHLRLQGVQAPGGAVRAAPHLPAGVCLGVPALSEGVCLSCVFGFAGVMAVGGCGGKEDPVVGLGVWLVVCVLGGRGGLVVMFPIAVTTPTPSPHHISGHRH